MEPLTKEENHLNMDSFDLPLGAKERKQRDLNACSWKILDLVHLMRDVGPGKC